MEPAIDMAKKLLGIGDLVLLNGDLALVTGREPHRGPLCWMLDTGSTLIGNAASIERVAHRDVVLPLLRGLAVDTRTVDGAPAAGPPVGPGGRETSDG